MRKPFFPRLAFFLLFYGACFVALVSMQFAKQGGFTQRVGSFVVTGQYRLPGENDPPGAPNEYFLEGETHIFFGGIDFCIAGLLLSGEETGGETLPERMVISGDSLYFIFPGETELRFTTQYAGGVLEMRIDGVFAEDAAGMEIPFKPQRRTGIREAHDGQLIVNADGISYSFGRSLIDAERRTLLISAETGPVSYRVIPEQRAFSPGDFILAAAETEEVYNEVLTRWRDQNFSLWNRTVSEQNDEDTVIALQGEAIIRGTYRAAAAAVPAAFLRSSARTYESSVYFGNMDQAYRALITGEREKLARLSRFINEKSLEFLMEPGIFEYFAIRGHQNYMDAGAELIRAVDPAILALDITPGILEGYVDWKIRRPGTENPFERLVDQACFVISESLKRISYAGQDGLVLSFYDDQADTVFNLRLGKALLRYAETGHDSLWAGIGRSLILSALSMGDAAGAVRAGLVLSGNGEIMEDTYRPGLTTARLYRILRPVDYSPRAEVVISPNIWTWTAGSNITCSQEDNVLDITVNFPMVETHYMIIRGIRPFSKIQLYNMDFRTDPQFERYDSSGWVYYSQEQTLVLKMKHRAEEEHIRVFY
jgi:hypothetical protein